MRGVIMVRRVGALLLCLELLPRAALACSPAVAPWVEPDPAKVGVDVTPPVLANVEFSVERDVPNDCVVYSIVDLGADAWDDQTPPEKLAYRVEALSGDSPLDYYDEPMAYMRFLWVGDVERPLDFEVRVRAVDEAGNESNPMDVHVVDGVGSSANGCHIGRSMHGAIPGWLSLLVAMMWAVRRRGWA